MAELFDPAFAIQFKCDRDIEEIASEFKSKFESMMIQWQGRMGQNEDCYFAIGRDRAYELGLSPYPYEFHVAGNGKWEDSSKQKAHIAFARSVVTHLQEQGCLVEFTAYFTLDD